MQNEIVYSRNKWQGNITTLCDWTNNKWDLSHVHWCTVPKTKMHGISFTQNHGVHQRWSSEWDHRFRVSSTFIHLFVQTTTYFTADVCLCEKSFISMIGTQTFHHPYLQFVTKHHLSIFTLTSILYHGYPKTYMTILIHPSWTLATRHDAQASHPKGPTIHTSTPDTERKPFFLTWNENSQNPVPCGNQRWLAGKCTIEISDVPS